MQAPKQSQDNKNICLTNKARKTGLAITFLIATLIGFQESSAQLQVAAAYPKPDSRYKADMLLVVAHPDDETAVGSYLAKAIFDEHKEVAIVYCTRGSGGGNSIGNEQAASLGAIREIESRRAAAAFGIFNVWFVDGRDTPGQDVFHSLQGWKQGTVLEQIVRLMRLTRPEVVITWLPHYAAGENHGDHHYQLAAELHKFHLTQGDVSEIAITAVATGDFQAFRAWLSNFKLIFGKSVVQCSPTGEVFEGITSTDALFAPRRGYTPESRHGISLTLGGAFEFYREFWKAHNIEHLGPLVAPEVEVGAGSYVHIPLLLRNDTPDSAEVRLTAVLPEHWKEVSGSARYRLGPFASYPAQTFFFAPPEAQAIDQEIVWKAETRGKLIGSVTMKVTVKEWALPQ